MYALEVERAFLKYKMRVQETHTERFQRQLDHLRAMRKGFAQDMDNIRSVHPTNARNPNCQHFANLLRQP